MNNNTTTYELNLSSEVIDKIFYVEEDYINDGEWYKLKSMKKVDCVKDDSLFNNF